MQKEQYENLHIENTAQTIDLTAECCHEMGLEPYYLYRQKNMAGNFENVGYAKPGKAGVYNILIMEEKSDHYGAWRRCHPQKLFLKMASVSSVWEM